MSIKIPYDPDFDTAPQQNKSPDIRDGLFANASPKFTFLFGLVFGIAVVSFIGFIILLL